MEDPEPGTGAACYGSGSGSSDNIKQMLRRHGPVWPATKSSFKSWMWQASEYYVDKGLADTVSGANRHLKESKDATERNEYNDLNRRLFGETVRMINSEKMTISQQTMVNRIENEFGNDRDGYELVRYLTLWANSLTNAEVKVLKLKLQLRILAVQETVPNLNRNLKVVKALKIKS